MAFGQCAKAVFHPPQVNNGKFTSHRLLDERQAGVYRGKRHIPPILGLFEHIHVPYPKGLNCWNQNVEKMTPPFCGSKIMNLLVSFSDFEPKKCFRVLTPWGLYGAELDER